MKEEICRQYKVRAIGEVPEIIEEIYLLTTDRRLNDPQ